MGAPFALGRECVRSKSLLTHLTLIFVRFLLGSFLYLLCGVPLDDLATSDLWDGVQNGLIGNLLFGLPYK